MNKMSSAELAQIIGVGHSDLLKKIRAYTAKKLIAGEFTLVQCKANRRSNPLYFFDRKDAMKLVETMSAERQEIVVARWRELEADPKSKPTFQQPPKPVLPVLIKPERVVSSTRYATIESVTKATGEAYPERPLALWCQKEQMTPIPFEDLTGRLVPGWPAAAWWEVYEVDIAELFK